MKSRTLMRDLLMAICGKSQEVGPISGGLGVFGYFAPCCPFLAPDNGPDDVERFQD